ncbi:hypothetical protein [Streptomyces sp. NPDC006368]|uniref:hypothetical protein n=1 Tax=Streptomyces sp. NPDC006368 TaxID=3156760 RepID=UPI0033AC625F
MADERDEWLDQDAAERLLRGEPVDPVDGHAREQARRLTEALEAVRAEGLASGKTRVERSGEALPGAQVAGEALPGEEAALAAFREVRAAKAADPSRAASSGLASHGADLGAVRLGSAARKRVRGRWARPMRWGLAASVAGLAVGGVAVAASTGVLPVLGEDREPVPVASSPSAATPGPSDSGEPTGGPGTGRPRTPGEPSGPPASAPVSPTPSAPSSPLPEEPGPGGDNVSGGVGGTGTEPGDSGRVSGGSGTGGWYAGAAQACRDYRQGRLDADRRRSLEASAKGDTVKKFCDRLLGAGAHTREGGTSGGNDTGTGGGTGAGEGGNDGDENGNGNGGSGKGKGNVGRSGDGKGGDKHGPDFHPSLAWSPLTPATPATP